MTKYYIVEKQACVVTWRYVVEAKDEAEALEMYRDGNHSNSLGPEIGDSLDFVQYDLEVEPVRDGS